jgi:hypothetical protein
LHFFARLEQRFIWPTNNGTTRRATKAQLREWTIKEASIQITIQLWIRKNESPGYWAAWPIRLDRRQFRAATGWMVYPFWKLVIWKDLFICKHSKSKCQSLYGLCLSGLRPAEGKRCGYIVQRDVLMEFRWNIELESVDEEKLSSRMFATFGTRRYMSGLPVSRAFSSQKLTPSEKRSWMGEKRTRTRKPFK